MSECTNCNQLRHRIKTIRQNLEELKQLLANEGESRLLPLGEPPPDTSDRFDFFDQITRPEELPADGDLFRKTLSLIVELGYASIMVLQQRLELSYRQATDLIAELERAELVSAAHGFRPHATLPAAYALLEKVERQTEESEFQMIT